MRSTVLTVLLAGAVVAAATGCTDGATPGSAPATSAAPVSSGGGNPSATGNPGPTTGASATTTSADTPIAACAPGQVEITAKGRGAAMSHHGITLTFSIANPAQACTLHGYPGLDETTDTGEVIHAERTPGGYMAQDADPEATVVVKSGHPAQAVAESVACGVFGKPDLKVVKTQVTPPNSTDTRTVDASLDTCNLKIHPVTA
ncbi:DUF4232 domain-containing protein [Nocardia tengchongensis]|uniref:DUF4232 domain-containing protein n=1 Tax=Nocardia tengchongensis TaxID=2055889 RepID=A0ABX8CGC1_9NOCA|nr:DUF4232 domain-containing protein [Nocardia tengchongensis]QVI19012.1 DUF4232 domain-containing protein [Nocardia tengchongensis]